VSSHAPFMRLHGARMADAGFAIVPIAAGQKWPGEFQNGRWWPLRGWEAMAFTGSPEALIDIWANYPGCGIGIACGGKTGVIGVDIDVLDAEIAGAIRRKFEEMLGETPLVRVGKAPKCMLVYRVTERMEKLSYQPIEVLATGQQFVAWGVHPDTGLPYTWPKESPTETTVESLPLVTPAQVREACEAAYALIPEELRPKRLPLNREIGVAHTPSNDQAPATPAAIAEALQHIPNGDVPWDEFKKVLMATFACSQGSEAAYFEFLKWSRKSAKHNDEATRREWTSCRSSPPRSLGFGTLHHLAKEHGWVPSPGLAFNTAKDVSDVDISGFEDMPLEMPPAIPVIPRPHRATVGEKLAAAPATERPALLASVGLAETETTDPQTGEVTSIMYPVADPGGQPVQEFIAGQLQAISEDVEHLFRFEEPKQLRLTQEEIEHGTLPREFIDQFPQE